MLKRLTMPLMMACRMEPMPLTMAIRQAPMALKTDLIWVVLVEVRGGGQEGTYAGYDGSHGGSCCGLFVWGVCLFCVVSCARRGLVLRGGSRTDLYVEGRETAMGW